MRRHTLLLLALLPLAACGGNDEAFRGDYRARSLAQCETNVRAELSRDGSGWDDAMTRQVRTVCACTVERAMAAHSDAELRSQLERTTLSRPEVAEQRRFLSQCTEEAADRAAGIGPDDRRRHLEKARNIIGNQGSPSFRRPDGSFDRADYRRVMVPGCAAGLNEGSEGAIPAEPVNRFCSCAVELVLAWNPDDALFAMNRDSARNRSQYIQAHRACESELPRRQSAAGTPPGNAAAASASGSAPGSR